MFVLIFAFTKIWTNADRYSQIANFQELTVLVCNKKRIFPKVNRNWFNHILEDRGGGTNKQTDRQTISFNHLISKNVEMNL